MLAQEPRHERALEVAALPRARGIENLVEQIREPATEPDAEWDAEPLLAPVENPRRQQGTQRLLEYVLAAAITNLEARGKRGRKIDDVVVEQRHA
jgi:hypothetical protein